MPHPDANPCLATATRKASRRLTQLYDDMLEPCGLRSTQMAILVELDLMSEPPTVAELAAALVTDRSGLGHTLRPLERDGLIALLEGTKDRRRRNVVLTAHGKAKLREAMPLWMKAQERFVTIFGELEAERLRATLLAIAEDERLAKIVGPPE